VGARQVSSFPVPPLDPFLRTLPTHPEKRGIDRSGDHRGLSLPCSGEPLLSNARPVIIARSESSTRRSNPHNHSARGLRASSGSLLGTRRDCHVVPVGTPRNDIGGIKPRSTSSIQRHTFMNSYNNYARATVDIRLFAAPVRNPRLCLWEKVL